MILYHYLLIHLYPYSSESNLQSQDAIFVTPGRLLGLPPLVHNFSILIKFY